MRLRTLLVFLPIFAHAGPPNPGFDELISAGPRPFPAADPDRIRVDVSKDATVKMTLQVGDAASSVEVIDAAFESPGFVTALNQTDSNLNGDFFSYRTMVNPRGREEHRQRWDAADPHRCGSVSLRQADVIRAQAARSTTST